MLKPIPQSLSACVEHTSGQVSLDAPGTVAQLGVLAVVHRCSSCRCSKSASHYAKGTQLRPMWETTFPKNSHAGLGRYFTKMFPNPAWLFIGKVVSHMGCDWKRMEHMHVGVQARCNGLALAPWNIVQSVRRTRRTRHSNHVWQHLLWSFMAWFSYRCSYPKRRF